jgi:hypothetical protein
MEKRMQALVTLSGRAVMDFALELGIRVRPSITSVTEAAQPLRRWFLSKTKNLLFEYQSEPFRYFFRGLTFGKISAPKDQPLFPTKSPWSFFTTDLKSAEIASIYPMIPNC